MQSPLRVLIVDETPERAALIEAKLIEAGCHVLGSLIGRADLRETINQLQPDVIIIDMECPDRDTLEDMSRMTQEQPRPTVMFVDRSDSDSIRAAVQAGVSAYVVDGLGADRVRPILEVAIARFTEFQRLRSELESAKSTLEDRKLVERAKGILMTSRGLSEDAAFRMLRKVAMDRRVPLAVVAREVVGAAELLA